MRRAKISAKYTEGFNPKPRITFGPPIPLGIESEAEYADVNILDDISPEDFVSAMNNELEGKIIISGARDLPAGVKSLMSQVDIAEYEIIIDGDAVKDIETRSFSTGNEDLRPLGSQQDHRTDTYKDIFVKWKVISTLLQGIDAIIGILSQIESLALPIILYLLAALAYVTFLSIIALACYQITKIQSKTLTYANELIDKHLIVDNNDTVLKKIDSGFRWKKVIISWREALIAMGVIITSITEAIGLFAPVGTIWSSALVSGSPFLSGMLLEHLDSYWRVYLKNIIADGVNRGIWSSDQVKDIVTRALLLKKPNTVTDNRARLFSTENDREDINHELNSISDGRHSEDLQLIRNNKKNRLKIKYEFINEHEAWEITQALQTCSHFYFLSLENVRIDPDYLIDILSAALDKHVNHIHLISMSVGDMMAERISELLKHNESLVNLDLSANYIGDHGAEQLHNAIEQHPNIKLVKLNYNEISSYGESLLKTLPSHIKVDTIPQFTNAEPKSNDASIALSTQFPNRIIGNNTRKNKHSHLQSLRSLLEFNKRGSTTITRESRIKDGGRVIDATSDNDEGILDFNL